MAGLRSAGVPIFGRRAHGRNSSVRLAAASRVSSIKKLPVSGTGKAPVKGLEVDRFG